MNIEFITITSWGILALIGLSKIFLRKRDYAITSIFSFVLIAVGINIVINSRDLSNLAFGVANMASGTYLLIRGGIEHWEKKEIKKPKFLNRKVIKYIKKRREEKISDFKIKKELVKAGWKEKDIKGGFENV